MPNTRPGVSKTRADVLHTHPHETRADVSKTRAEASDTPHTRFQQQMAATNYYSKRTLTHVCLTLAQACLTPVPMCLTRRTPPQQKAATYYYNKRTGASTWTSPEPVCSPLLVD